MPAILIIKTSSLGDVIHNLPIVADIHAHVPGARLDWLVEAAYADIPALHPGVRRVIPVALRRWRRAWWRAETWSAARAFVRELRTERYDLVLDTQGLLKSAALGAWAHGPMAGQDRRSAREPLAARFYQRAFPVARDRHAVTRNRDLAAQALGYVLPATPPDYGLRTRPDADVMAVLPARYAVCLHGTARASKRWPDAYWVALGRVLAARGLIPLLSWGGTEERARAQSIAAAIPGALVPATRLGLRELPTVLDKAAVVIGVDTGLMHLAAALGRPTVAIYVDTWPQFSGALPSDPARAVNLGGSGELPAPEAVSEALARLEIF